MDERIRDRIESALKDAGGQYVEVHVEEASSSAIRYRGNDLEEIGRGSGVGGNVRALDGGGWGFASFNDLSNLESKIHQAIEQARVVGGERIETGRGRPLSWIHVPAVIGLDPGSLTLADKKDILDEYASVMMGTPGVQSATVGYSDARRRMVYANSEGSYVDQERIDVNLRLNAQARNGADIQQYGVSLGSLGDFEFVMNLHEDAREAAEKAVALLDAPEVRGGRVHRRSRSYPCGRLHPRSVRAPVRGRPHLRGAAIAGADEAGQAVRRRSSEREGRRDRPAPLAARLLRVRRRGRTGSGDRPDPRRRARGQAAFAGDGGEARRASHGQRSRVELPLRAHRADDQYVHRAGRDERG